MSYSTPMHGRGGQPGSYPVFPMPVAITVARGFQILISFVVLVLAGVLMHALVRSQETFSLICGLFTIIIVIYALLAEKVSGCRAAYNYWAILSLDLVMIIFWLASLGAMAAMRASYTTRATGVCTDDGSALNADHCTILKRDYVYYASNGALAAMSAIAGLSALMMLLMIASFAYLAHQVRLHLSAQKAGVFHGDAGVVEMVGTASNSANTAPNTMYNPHMTYGGAAAAGAPSPSPGPDAQSLTASAANYPYHPQQAAYEGYTGAPVAAPAHNAYAQAPIVYTPSQSPAPVAQAAPPYYQQQQQQHQQQYQQHQPQQPYPQAAIGQPNPFSTSTQPYYSQQ